VSTNCVCYDNNRFIAWLSNVLLFAVRSARAIAKAATAGRGDFAPYYIYVLKQPKRDSPPENISKIISLSITA
jgi:hypothetical protein